MSGFTTHTLSQEVVRNSTTGYYGLQDRTSHISTLTVIDTKKWAPGYEFASQPEALVHRIKGRHGLQPGGLGIRARNRSDLATTGNPGKF